MSFASVGSLGTTSTKAPGTTLTISPSASVAAGQLVACFFAWDGGTSLGETYDAINGRWSCHDDAGNIWTTVVAITDGFNHGAGGIFVSRLKNGLTTSSVITVECQITARTCKALSLWEFDCDPDLRWATPWRSPGADTGRLLDPEPITIAGMFSREYLFLHVLASRGPSTDAFTWDPDYTQITAVGTTGGTDTSNITLRGGFRIATLTTETVDVTSDTADRDCAQGLAAIHEVAFPNNFPVLVPTIFDDFNRADENPLGGGIWFNMTDCIPTFQNQAQIVSNEASGQPGGHGGQWALTELDCPEIEIYATFPSIAGTSGAGLVWHGSGCGNHANRSGFEFQWMPAPNGKSVRDRIDLGNAGHTAGGTAIEQKVWIDAQDGYKFGCQSLLTGNEDVLLGIPNEVVNNLYIDIGQGWEWAAAMSTGPPLAFNGSVGKVGFELYDGGVRMDDFTASNICFVTIANMNWRSAGRKGTTTRALKGVQ